MAEVLNKILPQIVAEQNFINYDIQIDPVSTGGSNYTSNLYNVTIKKGTNTHYLFAKVAALGEKMRSQGPRLYNTEIFVYTKLTKIYEAMENEHRVPKEHRLVLSKFYGCNPKEYEESVVLENLVKKGYHAYDRFKSISWEYAASAMTELAKFHALSFAYSEYYPEDFNKVLSDLEFDWQLDSEPMVEYVTSMSQRAIDLVHEKKRDKLKRFFEIFGEEKTSRLHNTFKKPVLVHGDFRPSNLMHRISADGTVDIKILDLQTVQGGSPVIDLIYFIFTGSDSQFRDQYYEKLLDYYYTQLQAAMKRFNLDPEKVYSRADFDNEWKEKLPFGLSIGVFTLPLVTVSPEDAPEFDEDFEFFSMNVNKANDRYTELLNGIVDDFVKWGVLQ